MFSAKSNSVFIHVPKTGGTTIEQLMGWDDSTFTIGKGGHPHLNIQETNIVHHREINTDTKWFTVIRNPWDRLVSEYFWMKRDPKVPQNKTRAEVRGVFRKLEFPDFCGVFWDNFLFGDHRHRLATTWFFNDYELTDFAYVGKFERYSSVISDLGDLIDLPQKFDVHAHKNKKEDRKPYWEYYTDVEKSKISECWGKDIATLGYTFGEEDGIGTY